MTLAYAFDIPSALTAAEAQKLHDLAAGGGPVLELGSQFGRSTIALASSGVQVHAVDSHLGDPMTGVGQDSLQIFSANLKRYGYREKVSFHVGRFDDVLPVFAERVFEGIFLDGFHEAEQVYADGVLARPLLAPGGWFAFHDYGRFTVAEAVHRLEQEWSARMEVVDFLAVLYG